MFGPKHTIESVTKELIDGLNEGSIVLREEDLPKVDLDYFEKRLESELQLSRKKENVHFAAVLVSFLVGFFSMILSTILSWTVIDVAGHGFAWPYIISGILSLSILSIFWQMRKAFKSRERTVELKTYSRVMKIADEVTAERIAKRVSASVSNEEMAHSS